MTLRSKHLSYLTIILLSLVAVACDVHEWPEPKGNQLFTLRLDYDTDFTVWNQEYSRTDDLPYSRYAQPTGIMTYIVRAFPLSGESVEKDNYQEIVFERDVTAGYNCQTELDLAPGKYRIMVWSHLKENEKSIHYYDADDFSAIRLSGDHTGNTDYREAFRGTLDINIKGFTVDKDEENPGGTVLMQRPMAKFEFVSTDLEEFLQRETGSDIPQGDIGSLLDNYDVVFYYPMYMPNTYNMHTDKPEDSATGINFDSAFHPFNDAEISLGFDYVFVNGVESSVTVQIAVFRKRDGKRVSATPPIRVPLRRNYHTVMRGSFLLSQSSGGVGINPDFNGDINIFF